MKYIPVRLSSWIAHQEGAIFWWPIWATVVDLLFKVQERITPELFITSAEIEAMREEQ